MNFVQKDIGSLVNMYSGGTPKTSEKKYYNGEIPWIKSGEIDFRDIWETEDKITKAGLENSSAKMVPKNTVLLALYGATAGKTAITRIEASINQAILALIPNEQIYYEFLYYSLITKTPKLLSLAVGAAQPNLNQRIVRNTQVPLPPLPEQRKIAAILSSVDRAIEATQQVIAKTERLKKGMMQKLFSEGIGHDEFKETRIGRRPKSWSIKKLGEVLKNTMYGLSESLTEEETSFPVLRMGNIQNGLLDLEDLKYLPKEKIEDNKRYLLNKHDIVFNRTNSMDLVGKTAIIDTTTQLGYASYLIKLEVDPNLINPYFLTYIMNHSYFYNRIKSLATPGVSQANINATNLRKHVIIPVPTIEEQEKIVKVLRSFDLQKSKNKEEIEKLQKLKKSLMQQLLTGKIRVKTN